jgi:hypothetical protein
MADGGPEVNLAPSARAPGSPEWRQARPIAESDGGLAL